MNAINLENLVVGALVAVLSVVFLAGFSMQVWLFLTLPVRLAVWRWRGGAVAGPLSPEGRWYDYAASGLIAAGIAGSIAWTIAGR